MTRYIRISTFIRAAVSLALASGRTLKPTTMAPEVAARVTSDSLMAPTAQWMTRTRTSSLVSFSKEALTASADPWTSALTMTFQVLHLKAWIWLNRSSSVTLPTLLFSALLLMLALLHQLAGHTLVSHGMEVITCAGHLAHTDDLHGHRGAASVTF